MWKANALHIKGETLGNVHFAINYLTNPDVYKLGEKITIIGAGNAAMDVARTAIRNGASEVTCFSIDEKVAASDYEFKYAKLEGVRFEYGLKPVEILDNGVIFRKVTQNVDGTYTETDGEDMFYPSSSVVIAISQGPRNVIVSSTTGLNVNKRGLLDADEYGNTTRQGVFASGDVVSGARSVVEAVARSKVVAEAMHNYMQSLGE